MGVPSLRPGSTERSSGVLVHPTSLPGNQSGGDLGPVARAFAAELAAAGQRWWQMLPVGPVGYGNSPYSSESAFAGNPALLSLDSLVDDGLIPPELRHGPRDRALRQAFEAFERRPPAERRELEAWSDAARDWLDDFALYRALKHAHGEVEWTRWHPGVRDRDPGELQRARVQFADEIRFRRFEQYRFALDWCTLRAACASAGVGLIGDIPIFLAHDSADVWQHREMFFLDAEGRPSVVAGVPPDYFSTTGQRWGNPLYRWDVLRAQGFRWWIERFRSVLSRFDAVRVDHFIGFHRNWEIAADEPTAVHGRWLLAPGADLFLAVEAELGHLPLIAEDLGLVTPEVRALRDRFNFPGIKLLQFAFGTDPQADLFLPHNYVRRSVAYTGTHDNDTTVGWFADPGGPGRARSPEECQKERLAAMRYLGVDDSAEIHWKMIRMVMMSVADLAIFPMQDILGLGTDARMNTPGTARGNWAWRMAKGAFSPLLRQRLRDLTETYGRLGDQD